MTKSIDVPGRVVICHFSYSAWTPPRFRYDQPTLLGRKILLPLSLGNIYVTAGIVWWDPSLELLKTVGVAVILLFIRVVIAGPRRPSSSRASSRAAAAHGQ